MRSLSVKNCAAKSNAKTQILDVWTQIAIDIGKLPSKIHLMD